MTVPAHGVDQGADYVQAEPGSLDVGLLVTGATGEGVEHVDIFGDADPLVGDGHDHLAVISEPHAQLDPAAVR